MKRIKAEKIIPEVGTVALKSVNRKTIHNEQDSDVLFSFKNEQYIMSPKHRLFCMEYVRSSGNGVEACKNAGYSVQSSSVTCRELLKRPDLQKYIKALQEDLAFRIGVSAEDIAREYKKIGFSNIKDLFDENGRMKTVDEYDEDAGAAVSEYQVIDTKYGEKRVVKRFDKIKALQNLSRMLGVEGEVQVKVNEDFTNAVPKDKLKDLENQLKSLL